MSHTEATGRTAAEIVQQTEELALLLMTEFYRRESTGKNVPVMRKGDNPRAQHCWQIACKVQELLTATDPEDALSELDDEPAELEGAWNLWCCAQDSGRDFWVASGTGSDMRQRLAEEAGRGRDVWLVDPAGAKHLP